MPSSSEGYENIEPDLEPMRTRASSRDLDLDRIIAKIERSDRDQQGRGLKLLQPEQLTTRLPVLMVQVGVGNNSKSLLNQIQQIAYSLLRSRYITKKAQ